MTDDLDQLAELIVREPRILGGKPVLRGTRLSVEAVLGQFVCEPTLDGVFAAYPELTVEEVRAVLFFALRTVAADHRRSRRRLAATVKS